MERYVVGVDVGTGSARAGVFSATDGTRLGMASRPIRIGRPQGEFVEQSSANIWEAVGQSVREAVEKSGIDAGQIVGIGFDATCSLVVLDEGDEPLTVSPTGESDWNVIVWMDHRALAETDALNASGADVLKYVGGKLSPEMELPKLLWLKKKLPQTLGNSRQVPRPSPTFSFTGHRGSTRARSARRSASGRTLGHESRFDTAFLEEFGLNDSRITSPPKSGRSASASGRSRRTLPRIWASRRVARSRSGSSTPTRVGSACSGWRAARPKPPSR